MRPATTALNTAQSNTRNAADPPVNRNPSEKQTTTSAYGVAKSGVGFIASAADAFPPLKSVVGALMYILMHHEKWLKNKIDVERLIERIKNLQDILEEEEIGTREGIQRQKLRGKFQSVADALEAMKAKNKSQKYIAAQDDAEKVSGRIIRRRS